MIELCSLSIPVYDENFFPTEKERAETQEIDKDVIAHRLKEDIVRFIFCLLITQLSSGII